MTENTAPMASSSGEGGLRVRSAGQAMVDALLAHNVDTVFGVPGVQTYPIFDALGEVSDRITTIGARNEQACAYMAFGYAQATGRPGVFSVVPGPGVMNASGAILTGYGASVPMVCLTSEIPSNYLGRGFGHLHEMPDQLGTLRGFTKWADNVLEPSQTAEAMAEAFSQATSGRPGPTSVAIPWDVLPKETVVSAPFVRRRETPTLDTKSFEAAAQLLSQAKNPLILVGSGARQAGDSILALARHIQAPVVSFRGGRGVVPNSDVLGFTSAEGHERWADADVVLGIGTRLELTWLRWPAHPGGMKLINIDIDPKQHVRLTPEIGITADAAEGSAELLRQVQTISQPAADRTEEFAAVRAQFASELDELQPHANYLGAIRAALPADGFFVEEISQMGFSSIFGLPVERPREFITGGCQGALGFGYPTALGVKAAFPERAVISVNGDGGFLFGASELATAVQYGLGVVAIVFDNAAYGNVKADQLRIYGRTVGSELVNPDFVALAESYGARGVRAENPDELQASIEEAIELNQPTVIVVPMPLEPAISPWRFLAPTAKPRTES